MECPSFDPNRINLPAHVTYIAYRVGRLAIASGWFSQLSKHSADDQRFYGGHLANQAYRSLSFEERKILSAEAIGAHIDSALVAVCQEGRESLSPVFIEAFEHIRLAYVHPENEQ